MSMRPPQFEFYLVIFRKVPAELRKQAEVDAYNTYCSTPYFLISSPNSKKEATK